MKQRFRELEKGGAGKALTKRPVEPSEEETRSNPPSRSAKLRAFEVAAA